MEDIMILRFFDSISIHMSSQLGRRKFKSFRNLYFKEFFMKSPAPPALVGESM